MQCSQTLTLFPGQSFSRANGELVLQTTGQAASKLVAGKFYTFSFELLNPPDGQSSPAITVAVGDVFTCISGPNAGASCSGVTDGGGLGTSCGIGGECVRVQIALSVMDADNTGLPVTGTTDLRDEIGTDDTTFSLAGISVASADRYIQVEYEFMLVTAVSGSNVTVVRGTLGSGRKPHVFGAPVYVILPGAAPGDAAPLKVGCPGFSLKKIGQSSFLPGELNTLSLTLVTNVALSNKAAITLTGLSGALNSAAQASSAVIDITGAAAGRFTAVRPGGVNGTALFDPMASTLSLLPVESITAGTTLKFAFVVRNPAAAQSAQSAQVLVQDVYGAVDQLDLDSGTLTVVDPVKGNLMFALGNDLSLETSGRLNGYLSGFDVEITTNLATERVRIADFISFYHVEAALLRQTVVLMNPLNGSTPTTASTYVVKAVLPQTQLSAQTVAPDTAAVLPIAGATAGLAAPLLVVGFAPSPLAVCSGVCACDSIVSACPSAWATGDDATDPPPCSCLPQNLLLFSSVGHSTSGPGLRSTIAVTLVPGIPIVQVRPGCTLVSCPHAVPI